MTVERRTLVDFSDVTALEFHCQTCNATMRKQTQEWNQVSAVCWNCRTQWFAQGSQEHNALICIVDAFKSLSQSTENRGYHLRLEINLGD